MGLYWYWDSGKENGNYYSIMGLYWDNGKETGNYYSFMWQFGSRAWLTAYSSGSSSDSGSRV